jgi:membrane protease subunit HflC
MNRTVFAGVIVAVSIVVGLLIASTSAFTVHQTQQAIVFQFGDPKAIITDPGLHWKWPWQSARYVEGRVLNLDPAAEEIVDKDKNRLVVDVISRYRIENPLLFVQSFGSEAVAEPRLAQIVIKAMRDTFAVETLNAVLSDRRESIMQRIQDFANTAANQFGIKFVDLRVRRADLPKVNAEAIYQSMQTERERDARQLRAEGQELAVTIRAGADRERVELVAKAKQRAQELRGDGDSGAIKIYADSFNQDPEFFAFYRSMEAYRNALGGEGTTFVLSPDSDFFRFFDSVNGTAQRQR